MLPEVAAYFATMDNSTDYYTAIEKAERANPLPRWSDTLSESERAAYYEADNKRAAAVRQADHDHKERAAKAREALNNSADPLVKWIADHGSIRTEYRSHMDAVLRALPMTREEMEEFGDRQSWCGEYNRLLRQADRAGVLPAPEPEIADIEPLVSEMNSWYGGNDRKFRAMIKKHLPAILESAKQKAAEKELAAV